MIRFENVGLRYGLGPEVLRDVSFHLLPGSFHFLTGSSGAGKTSLLRMLFLSLKPSRGLAYMFGKNVTRSTPGQRAELRRRIGIVFQDFRLLDHMTTWENVALPLARPRQAPIRICRGCDGIAEMGGPRRADARLSAGSLGR